MENKRFFQKIKEAINNLFKGKTRMKSLLESTNQIKNKQDDRSIDKTLIDRGATEEKSFRKRLKMDSIIFEKLEPENVQKKILDLLGVNPELVNSPIFRDTVFKDFISKIKDNPMEVYKYFKENCTVNSNSFGISINNAVINPNTTYDFILDGDNLKMFENNAYNSNDSITNYDIHSIFDKKGLELYHKEELYEMYSNSTKTVRYKYELTRENIDKAKYVNLFTNQTETLDLIAKPSWDIALLHRGVVYDSKTKQIMISNIYEEPKDIIERTESGNRIISGQSIRNIAIKKAIQSSKYKQACLSYIKENNLNLYNEIDSEEQNQ